MTIIYNKFFAQPAQLLFQHEDYTNNAFAFAALNTPHTFLSFVMPANGFSKIYAQGYMRFNNNAAAGFMEFFSQVLGLTNSITGVADILSGTVNQCDAQCVSDGSLQAGGTISLSGQQTSGANFGQGVSLGLLVWAIV